MGGCSGTGRPARPASGSAGQPRGLRSGDGRRSGDLDRHPPGGGAEHDRGRCFRGGTHPVLLGHGRWCVRAVGSTAAPTPGHPRQCRHHPAARRGHRRGRRRGQRPESTTASGPVRDRRAGAACRLGHQPPRLRTVGGDRCQRWTRTPRGDRRGAVRRPPARTRTRPGRGARDRSARHPRGTRRAAGRSHLRRYRRAEHRHPTHPEEGRHRRARLPRAANLATRVGRPIELHAVRHPRQGGSTLRPHGPDRSGDHRGHGRASHGPGPRRRRVRVCGGSG